MKALGCMQNRVDPIGKSSLRILVSLDDSRRFEHAGSRQGIGVGAPSNSPCPLQAMQVVSCEHEVPIERHPVSKEVGFDVEFYSVSILSNEVTGNRFVEISAYDFPQCRPVDCDSDKPAIDYGEKLNGPRGWYFSMNE